MWTIIFLNANFWGSLSVDKPLYIYKYESTEYEDIFIIQVI